MEIKHYNAIAKIIGGNMLGDSKLDMLVNSLSKYFEEEDEAFNKHEFRAACLNGYNMVESDDTVPLYHKTEITPTNIENKAYNWNPKKESPVKDDLEFENAMARMSSIVGSNFKKKKE